MQTQLDLNPIAYEREAQRLRHMAHRAARCRDLALIGMPDGAEVPFEDGMTFARRKGHL